MSGLTPLYVPRSSPRPPGEPSRQPTEKGFAAQPVLHRHQAAAIEADRLRLVEERAAFEKEREEFERRAAANQPPAPERIRPVEPKRQAEPMGQPPLLPTDPKALADQIVKMGRVRRGELVPKSSAPRTEAEKMATLIVAAAAKARSTAPMDPELPEHPLAKAIVLCGRKARDTIDAAGERWLSDYFGKLESTRELLR